jgi:hypothetical protein
MNSIAESVTLVISPWQHPGVQGWKKTTAFLSFS